MFHTQLLTINNLTSYDVVYYVVLFFLVICFLLSMKLIHVENISSLFFFRNVSIVYYIFFSILFGKFVYEGVMLRGAAFNAHLFYLMLYYSAVLLIIATFFNLIGYKSRQLLNFRLNLLLFFIIIFLKVSLLIVDFTPLQAFIFYGYEAALIKQSTLHSGGFNIVNIFYNIFTPAILLILALYYRQSHNIFFKIVLLVLMFETSGYYFSKSGLILPLIILIAIHGIKVRYAIPAILVGIVAVFTIRHSFVNNSIISYLNESVVDKIIKRFILETGYANIHLDLINSHHPPLAYGARYFIGLNTLFNITPVVRYSTEAYTIATGRYGGTSSGHAAVHLYAFWGYFIYIVLPILISFIFYLDMLVQRKITTYSGLLAYIIISLNSINYLTVDIQRIISFQFVFNLTFAFSLISIYIVCKIVNERIFQKRIVLLQPPKKQVKG